jgi:hypothetical protein
LIVLVWFVLFGLFVGRIRRFWVFCVCAVASSWLDRDARAKYAGISQSALGKQSSQTRFAATAAAALWQH